MTGKTLGSPVMQPGGGALQALEHLLVFAGFDEWQVLAPAQRWQRMLASRFEVQLLRHRSRGALPAD